METKKITNWFNWLVIISYKTFNYKLSFETNHDSIYYYRREWKSVIDDAYNEEQNINQYKRAFSTIVAWETRFKSYIYLTYFSFKKSSKNVCILKRS